MEKDESSKSFLTSLPGILTALGTLVAAAAGLIALFLTHGGGKPSLSSSTGAGPTAGLSASSTASTTIQNVGGGPLGAGANPSPSSNPVLGGPSLGPTSAATSSPPPPPAITAVRFTGTSAAPTVIISGQGFGTSAPTGTPNNTTSCGGYASNGDDYGTNLWFIDNGNFSAGAGTSPKGSCIGITVLSWSDNQVTYQFGDAYNSFDHWYISSGDQYTLSLDGVPYSATVSFSG